MKVFTRISLSLVGIIASTSISFSQVIGGRESGEMTPTTAKAAELHGGSLKGDVNPMTGQFSSSVALGTVATPGGLMYNLSLDYSSSFSISASQAMSSGIPYGEGWGPNLPTISVEVDAFHKFRCSELDYLPTDSTVLFNDTSEYYNGTDEGDLYWFSPVINIPGVVSGRAIFKYVDVTDDKCLIFVLNKFETAVEVRYYGKKGWEVNVANGDTYSFRTHLKSYRAPDAQRLLHYSQTDPNTNNEQRSAVINSDSSLYAPYGAQTQAVQNVIEPKQSFTVWYCDRIFNVDAPKQGIYFDYHKYGKFNYFKEYDQEYYDNVRSSIFGDVESFSNEVYSDVHLNMVYSAVDATPVDIIELGYNTFLPAVDGQTILNINHQDVYQKDGLYNYTIEESWGDSTSNFAGWNRYKHGADQGFSNGSGDINSVNPYIRNGNYKTTAVGSVNDAEFDHGFLESNRILTNGYYVPGDIYEIRTKVKRDTATSLIAGNGTIDIAIKTGNNGNFPGVAGSSSYPNHTTPMTENDFNTRKGIEVFSTFNSPLKWQMGYGQGSVITSNFFVMPNVPSTYHGFNIQVGPGNSDIDFGTESTVNLDMAIGTPIDVREAYPYTWSNGRQIRATDRIPHNFGTGHPWAMMIPIYNEMALNRSSLTGSAAPPETLYRHWWATNASGLVNTPTKFDETVKLDKVELIRYSKNALMLDSVVVYKVSGEFRGLEDPEKQAWNVVARKKMDYEVDLAPLMRNYDYSLGDSLEQEGSMLRRIILLSKVSEVPLNGDLTQTDFGLIDSTQVLTTSLDYEKYFNTAGNTNMYYNDTSLFIPYAEGLNQYVLTSYTDALGGITRVEYYPPSDNATRLQSLYRFTECSFTAQARVTEAFGRDHAYTVYPAVRFLSKNDEDDVLLNSSNVLVGGSVDPNIKVWEYVYETDDLMLVPNKLQLPSDYFSGRYFNTYEAAYKTARVYEPFTDTNATARNYTDYEYFGDRASDSLLTIDEYLYYGKPKHIKRYSYNDVLEEETIFEYGHTFAFKNGYLRPNPIRERLWNDHPTLHSYEYEDIQQNDSLNLDIVLYEYEFDTTTNQWSIIDSTVFLDVTGPAAYDYVNVPYLNGVYSNREMPKFLGFYFFDSLQTHNYDFQLNSYFIKKTAEIHRTYEDGLIKGTGTSSPTISVSSMPANDPFGSGYENPTADDSRKDDPLIESINPEDEEATMDELIGASPLSDAVLNAVVTSDLSSAAKYAILDEQADLSNAIWDDVWGNLSSFSSSHVEQLADSQSYMADTVILSMINVIDESSSASMVEAVALNNSYLSGQVINDMLNSEITFPGSSFANIISRQPQLPEYDLFNILANSNTTSNNVNTILSGQLVTDTMFRYMLNSTNFTNESVTKVIESNVSYYPIDATLIDIIDHTPSFSNDQLTRIFAEATEPIGNEVYNRLVFHLGPAVADGIVGEASFDNSLSQYCSNSVSTGRTYIETRTDYEYYEADHTGKAVGKAYEVLMGMRENFEAASRLPFTISSAETYNLTGSSVNVNSLELKHEPSWMPFSITTSSPHLDGAYNREEYFYNYDLLNRYDRHWFNYDFDNNTADYTPIIDTIGGYERILVRNDLWPAYYQNGLYAAPEVPKFDAMTRNVETGNRSLAFQKTNISKNTRDDDPKYASEYYFYEKNWTVPGYPGGAQSVEFVADTCAGMIGGDPNDPCENYVDCNDCYTVFYKPFMQWEEIVPLGYCAWHVPSIGYIVCPSEHNPSVDFPNETVTQEHCGVYPTISSSLPYSQTFDDMVKLRSVFVQVDDDDHSTAQEFSGSKFDTKNSYIAEFHMDDPTVQSPDHYMIPPSDHLKVREVLERNRFGQVALEENSVGLKTKYHYNATTYIWNYDPNCSLANYTSRLNEVIGLPTRVEVGHTRADSLVTVFNYTPIGLVSKTVDPNGKSTEYFFDDYNRLSKITEQDTTRLLTEYAYHYWDLDTASTFEDRTDSSFVQTKMYSGVDSTFYSITKAFLDPLGRTQGSVIGYTEDGINHNAIHSGFVSYDNLGRVIQTEKTYISNYAASTVGDPNIPKTSEFNGVVEKVLFDSGYKGRPERASNFGVDIDSNEVVRNLYDIANNVYASCELDLNLFELELVMRPGGTANVRLFRTETIDQDGKRAIAYKNALGQDVATLRYNDNNEKIVTLFGYDSYGNLTKVINPEKQQSDYTYNRLGQLVIENTVDAGAKHFMYNKQGLVSIVLDDQGRFNLNGSTPNPFYRVMEYDDYGRLVKQGRSDIASETHSFYLNNDSTLYGPLHYKNDSLPNTLDNVTSVDRYFLYKFSDAQTQDYLYNYDLYNSSVTAGLEAGEMDVDYREKTVVYGTQQGTTKLGRVSSTLSFNKNDQNIQSNTFEYDAIGNISKQTVSFNAAGTVLGAPPAITSVIEYPSYNYQGSLLEELIDVNNDNIVDFHCYMDYDPMNRLKGIYVAAGEVDSLQDATLIVSYKYDDVTGKMSKREHSVKDITTDVLHIANEIAYQYDQRDRLTRITSGLSQFGFGNMFDYQMKYDDQVVDFGYQNFSTSVSHDNNWNGNVNGVSATYNFDLATVSNNVQGFDGPSVYGYDYDAINRLIAADGTVGDLLDTAHLNDSYKIGDVDISYDRIGNILELQRTLRNTDQAQGAPYTILQDFSYSYATDQNRLLSAVGGNAETATRNYTYDVIGNVLTDDNRNIVGTTYGRGAYAYELNIDPDGIPSNSDDETVSYLYSSNDLRIYKKHVTSSDTLEDYYLMDASGRTVAILKTGYTNDGWEYYAYGAEREARIKPTGSQTPGSNASATLDDKQIGKDNATFYVNDHLGNTRITYTPTEFRSTSNDTTVLDTDFASDTTGWTTVGSSISFGTGNMVVVTDSGAVSPYANYDLGTLTVGETYILSFYADLGTSSNLQVDVIGATLNTTTVQQGMNNLSFTYDNGFFAPDLRFQLAGGSQPSRTFTIDDVFVGQISGEYTRNRIEHVADYFPYGKILREFVESDEERYLTTQHERDTETGLDYRGARYYDSDVARFLSLDPKSAEFSSWSPFNYVLSNPVILVDPDGKAPQTDYYSKSGVLLLRTFDGSDDEITISNEFREEFTELVNWSEDSQLDSKTWNDNMKADILDFSTIESMEGLLGSTSSQYSRQALIDYLQDKSFTNYSTFLGIEVLGQNLNPINHAPAPIGIKTKLPKSRRLPKGRGKAVGGTLKFSESTAVKTTRVTIKTSSGASVSRTVSNRTENPWILFNREYGPGQFTKEKYGTSEKAAEARKYAYAYWKASNGY
ncbi:MAG: RHS repeat-associated core domain-containing protein [bacterium]|nr:RHS repeat-associated core domain-containing protein [bacterium]